MEHSGIKEINRKVTEESLFIAELKREMGKVIVGQDEVLERLLVCLVANGHVLLEGVPGLAKTLIIKTLSQCVKATFSRVQFTPDLLPADLTGTLILDHQSSEFKPRLGPIFANLVLADEINRAPAKVQSALLEAMQEHCVTIGPATHRLPDPFLVLATQNPIEQEGTYPLPEAQVDRFMMKIRLGYPNKAEEKSILERMAVAKIPDCSAVTSPEQILRARQVAASIYLDEKIKDYIVDLVFATREPEKHRMSSHKHLIAYGASPRATIALAQSAKAYAFINGRGYVTPEDIKAIGHDVLRHRILVSYEAEAENVDSDQIVRALFEAVDVP
ncbi:MAG TPA: ATPase [Elusimicrobia bacterium]|nr:MAG: ATPase [Elusimicrobia bacterium GWA2_66_18]OGR69438.1 MAG: ATPase [Elusimicrobia bacterium GWC2_65_9]HAZ08226.1 ATPase [Elusimicrobiota bacterium]